MLRRLLRPLIPLAGFAVGSWLGLAEPGPECLAEAAAQKLQALSDVSPAPSAGAEAPPPALERVPPTLDGNDLSAFPRLNPEASTGRAWLLAEGPARKPDNARRLVTFTFDDGPFPETTPTVLRILARHHIRATFFLIGRYLDGNDRRAIATRKVARQIVAAGHFIGNHTHDHQLLTTLDHARALAQIDDGARSIERATGQHPFFFRPPYGGMDAWLEGAARDRSLDLILWSVAVEDMVRDDPNGMVKDLKRRLEYAGGGVVLLHDMHWPSVKAFNRLLYWLEAHKYDPSKPDVPGYEIVDLREYMRATAAAPQPYATREQLDAARLGRAGVL
jgi:peptidoglycan/xylan/chitin deacetylase (PgdA/CDA1 family)